MDKKNQKRSFLRNKQNSPLKIRRKKNRKNGVLKKVVDYLLSDTYMYAPLVSSTTNRSSSTGPLEYLKKATSAITRNTTTKNHEQARERPTKETVSDGVINGVSPDSDRQHLGASPLGRSETTARLSPSPLGGRRESVKHMVHYTTHILSSPDRGSDDKIFASNKKQPVLNNYVTTRS